MLRFISRRRFKNILRNGMPYTTIIIKNLNSNDDVEIIGTYGIYFRHTRWDRPDIFEKISKSAQRYLYGKEVPRARTKCLVVNMDYGACGGRVDYGESDCSWSDQFSRAEGRRISLARACPNFGDDLIERLTSKGTGGTVKTTYGTFE